MNDDDKPKTPDVREKLKPITVDIGGERKPMVVSSVTEGICSTQGGSFIKKILDEYSGGGPDKDGFKPGVIATYGDLVGLSGTSHKSTVVLTVMMEKIKQDQKVLEEMAEGSREVDQELLKSTLLRLHSFMDDSGLKVVVPQALYKHIPEECLGFVTVQASLPDFYTEVGPKEKSHHKALSQLSSMYAFAVGSLSAAAGPNYNPDTLSRMFEEQERRFNFREMPAPVPDHEFYGLGEVKEFVASEKFCKKEMKTATGSLYQGILKSKTHKSYPTSKRKSR